eukprot:XP_780829.3 PREDICTED: carbohydrate sulfotransferase 15 [Strongylocentrotus purpuratus]
MAGKWFNFRSVLLPVLITEAVLLCICYNYMSAERSCETHSENQIYSELTRDSVVLTNVSSEQTFPDKMNFNQTDKDQLRRKSPEVVPLRPLNVVPIEVEPQYTVSYQRDVPTNYTDLFSTDSEGNCRASSCKWPKMPGATRELVASAPELFEKIPLRFLDNFKNPCWLRGETELNCLPYFYILGNYKCGTSDIWDKITAHPDVIAKVAKEPHWWGPRRNGYTFIPIHRPEVLQARNHTGGTDDSSLEWYLNLYKASVVPEIINSRITTNEGIGYHPKVFGDASISTVYAIGREWIKTFPYAAEPPYTNADLMHALQPNAKFILMIRNPTKRADSFFWYLHRPGDTDRWHQKATNYIQCFKKCVQDHNLRFCAYAAECPYDLIPDLQVGIYHVYIRDWLKVFPRDNFKVIRLEDWEAEPVTVYRDLLNFLDLRQLSVDEENRILKRRRSNQNQRQHEQTHPETLNALNDFHRPFNVELAKLMGDNKFNYPDYKGSSV